MMHSQNAHTMSSVRNTEKTRDEVLASVGRGFGLPRLGLLPPPRGRLCCRAGLTAPPYSHRWPSHPPTHPTCCYSPATAHEPVNPRTVVLPSAWETTAESSLPPCRSLPRPRRCPPPCCSRRGLVKVVNERHLSAVDCTWSG